MRHRQFDLLRGAARPAIRSVLALLFLAVAASPAAAASCTGTQAAGGGFSFSCDTAIAAYDPSSGEGGFFITYSSTASNPIVVSGGSVSSPSGFTCRVSHRGLPGSARYNFGCSGPEVPAGQTVVGSTTISGGSGCDPTATLYPVLEGTDWSGPLGPCPVAGGGTPGGGAPVLSALQLTPRAFALAGRLVRGRCVPVTATNRKQPTCRRSVVLKVSYRLSVAASLTFAVKKAVSGRLVGSFTRTGRAGANSFAFDVGRVGASVLGSGRYTLSATPAGGAGKSVSFQVL